MITAKNVLIEHVQFTMLYDLHFLMSVCNVGPNTGRCFMWNPNKAFGEPGARFYMQDTEEFPEGTGLRLTRGKLNALLDKPDEELPIIDQVIRDAWREYNLCPKCREKK
jgi:hypothetical protein